VHTVAELAQALNTQGQASAALPPITLADREQPIALSFAQERLWFVEQLDRASGAAYRIDGAVRLDGPLDENALESALIAVVNRHESLRTRFAPSQEHHAVLDVALDAQAARFSLRRVAALHASDEALGQCVAELLAEPFDLATGPLFRAELIVVDDATHVLVLSGHHAVLDGWSVATLLREVAELYANTGQEEVADVLPPLAVQYADYAAWQRNVLSADVLEQQLAWWCDALADAPPSVALPFDRARPDTIEYSADSVALHIPATVVSALDALAKAQDATLFMVLEALFAAYLARLGAGDDIVIGTVVAGRPKRELEPVVGYFANTVAIRNAVDPKRTVNAHVAACKDSILAALAHQEAPFDAVVNAVNPPRSLSHAPLVQVMLILQNVPGAAEVLELEDIDVSSIGRSSRHHATQFDLSLELGQASDGLHGLMTYATALFDRTTVERFAAGFARMLEAAVCAPESALYALPIMQEPVRDEVLRWAYGGDCRRAVEAIPALFATQVRTCATQLAVSAVVDGVAVDYAALDRVTDQIAHALHRRGVTAGDVVALCLSRTHVLPASMLAVWKLGAAFVPVNIDDGPERLRHVITDCDARLIVADADRANRLQEMDAGDLLRLDDLADAGSDTAAAPFTQPASDLQNDALAYIMYTSGSTGRPKGVAISHKALGAMRAAVLQDDALGTNDTLLCGFDTTFDVFVRDVALALSSGAHLVLLEPRDLLKAGRYGELAREFGATWMALTPTVWRFALADGWRPSDAARVEAGGEVMDVALATMLGEGGARVINAYGPTEATAVSIDLCLPDNFTGASVPIGRPLPGMYAYVVDTYLQPVPPGVPGELLLGGAQLAHGYLGRADLTAAAFIANPFSTESEDRLYRTGDLVRWRSDGQLDFLGRLDAQVKIHGMRIELGEIEAILCELPGVAAAAVATQLDAGGAQGLSAFIVGDSEPDAAVLRTKLSQYLPEHMIPRAFSRLAQIPLTPSGKIDRRALPQILDSVSRAPYRAPTSETEHAVVKAITELLVTDSAQSEPVGLGDNFFALGGHSMLAVQLVAMLERATGLSLPLRVVFDAPDFGALAAAIDELRVTGGLAADDSIDMAMTDIERVDSLPDAPAGRPPALAAARCVLMTGATGFIGRYFLHDLLQRTDGKIVCLVRGTDVVAERERILRAVNDIPGVALAPQQAARVEVVRGDIGEPGLGLDDAQRQRLIDSVDVILHNAAVVHAIKSYGSLRQANTLSVLHLLELMAGGRPKALVFVSTLGVLQSPIDTLADGFDTEALTPAADSGYNLSKWAAERLVINARKRGYSAKIMRPGLVIGDSRSGYYQTNDIGNGYALLFADTGAIPTAISSFALPWINVDRASRQMLDFASLDSEPDGLFHIFEHGALPGETLAGAMNAAGIPVDVVPVKLWLARALELLSEQPSHPASWLLPRLRAQAHELEGVAENDIELMLPNDLLARYAPPPWPASAPEQTVQPPADGLFKPMRWLAEQSEQRQEEGE
ncbi:MAG: amino acid adenylation domain-containing protein, partial [Gammaproteobacteria bacterium]